MVNIQKILLLLFIVVLFSCEEHGLFVKCPDCTVEEPLKIQLELMLDINHNGGPTIIKVYEGNLEDSVLYSSYTSTGTRTSIPVTINKKYTVTATYYIPGNYYITVNSATPRVRYEKAQCDNPCYFVYDKIIDLRLK
jgi:translation elongation factor EF-G